MDGSVRAADGVTAEAAAPSAGVRPRSGTETYLFTDIAGSTRLLQHLGDAFSTLLVDVRRLVLDAVHAHGGREAGTSGDGSFLVFRSAREAVEAAADAQAALHAHAWPAGTVVRVRMGLNSGESEIADGVYSGLDVFRAARIAAAGHGGQVLLSQATRELVERDLPAGMSLRDLGLHRLKDLEHAEHLHQLVIPDLPAEFGPIASLERGEGQPSALPVPVTSFVGREALLADLDEVLGRGDVRLLTLYGAGGTGKSRVAIELARRRRARYPGGVVYAALASVDGAAGVPQAVAAALGVRESAGVGIGEAIHRALTGRRALLVLDNFEHLLDASGFVVGLLVDHPELDVLVTSRSVLRLSGEVAYPVPPMDLPPPGALEPAASLSHHGAVGLFVERAQAADPTFRLDDDNAAAVVEICRRVDALPLAIELAAARVRTLPPKAILARLTKRLPLLTGGPRDAPARQRTLRDAIAWSHALLTPEERTLFARLALFAGSASFETVEAVLAPEAERASELLEALSSLLDKSLVQRLVDGDEVRVRMLETVREFAQERLQDDVEAEALRLVHARHFLALAERGAPEMGGPDQVAWLRRVDRDEPNMRAALATFSERGQTDEALRLATALRPYRQRRGQYREGRAQLEATLAAARDAPAALRSAGLRAVGALAWRQGELVDAEAALERSMELARAGDDTAAVADTLRLLGILAHNRADFGRARTLLEESLALARALGDEQETASVLLSLGNVALDRDEPEAEDYYRRSRTVAAANNDTLGAAFALDNLGVMAWCAGDDEEALRRTDEVEGIYRDLQHQLGHANVEHRRGLLAFGRGEFERAEAHYRTSLAIRHTMGEARGASFVRYDLGRSMLERGVVDGAAEQFLQGLELAVAQGAPVLEVLFVEGAAKLSAAIGRFTEAAVLVAAARAWRHELGVPGCRVNRVHAERLEAALAQALPPADRERAEHEGAQLAPREAVARARRAFARPAHAGA